MKNPLPSILLAAALTASALAQQAPADVPPSVSPAVPPIVSADAPATREDIQRLFVAMRVQEQIRLTMTVMLTQQRRMIGDMMRKRNRRVTEDDVNRASDSAQEFIKNFPLQEMVDDMIPVYQNHLTKTDVDVMTTFYTTPTGQKLLREQPAMAGESMEAVAARVQRALALAMDRADQKAKDDADAETDKQKTPPVQPPAQDKN